MRRLFRSYTDSYRGLSREIWFLALVTLVNRAGAMVVPFLSIYLTGQLNFTFAQAGWIMTAFGIGSLAGSWTGGWLTDRLGYYRVMVMSLVLTGIAFIALQYVQTFESFFIATVVLMVFADAFRPAGLTAVNAYSKPGNRTRSVTLIRLAINLGFSAGPAVGGWIIFRSGYPGLFWVDGGTCILAALLTLVLLRPRSFRTTAADPALPAAAVRSVYRDGPYLIFLLMCVLIAFSFMQLFSTVPLFYRESVGLTELTIGWLMASNGLLIALTEMPLVGYFERKRWDKMRVIRLSFVLIGASYAVLLLGSGMAILLLSMLLITVGEMLAFPFTNALAMERAPSGRSGAYLALYTMCFSAAHIVGPNIGMQLAAWHGFNASWILMVAVVGAAVLISYRLGNAMGSGTAAPHAPEEDAV